MATQKTVVGLRGDMTVNEKPVYIEAVFGDEVLLRIAEEFSFGSPISVTYWLKEKWALEGDGMKLLLLEAPYETGTKFTKAWNGNDTEKQKIIDAVKANLTKNGIPGPAIELMATALLAEVLVTDLLFQYKSEKTEEPKRDAEKVVKLGLAIKFGMPLNLLPGIEINKISLLVKSAPETRFAEVFSPKAPQLLPEPAPLPGKKKASGYIEFSKVPDASKITLDGEDWAFVTTAPNDGNKRITTIVAGKLEDTVKKLAEDLNKVTSPHIGACDYSCAAVDGAPANYRLEIQHKTPGAQGNRFEWTADTKANATASKGALTGGVSPEGELACGFVEFKSKIEKDASISVLGVPVTFAAAVAEGQVPAAITKWVNEAKTKTNVDVLKKYNFQASGNRLDFAAKEVGEEAMATPLPSTKPEFVEKQGFYPGANKTA